MRKIISTQVLYDDNAGGPYPSNVRVLFVMRDESMVGIEEHIYMVLYDPNKPEFGHGQWITQ